MVMGEFTQEAEVLVIGGGPAGYAAAFRAADLGFEVTMINKEANPGGVCLNRGCIFSKSLLYAATLIRDARRAEAMGFAFSGPKINLDTVRKFKDESITTLTDGLNQLMDNRKIQYINARAVFEDSTTIRLLDTKSEISRLTSQQVIVATGALPIVLPDVNIREGGRIMTYQGALNVPDIPEKLLVIGGGYIGLELGSVYAAMGSSVTLVEMEGEILSGADRDLIELLQKQMEEQFAGVYTNTTVTNLEEKDDRVTAEFDGEIENQKQDFDRVLIAIGLRPQSQDMGLDTAGVELDEKGFIRVDEQGRTSVENIFAAGDIIGGTMLAHVAFHQGKIAAEAIAGKPSAFDAQAVPFVLYTDPEIAWTGLTEAEADRQEREVEIIKYPWRASGRAVGMGLPHGITKYIIDSDSGRILGVGIAGRHASELIAEGSVAVEMGAVAEDLALIIHPHPTFSETLGEAAQLFHGTPTHVQSRKKKAKTETKT